jgi:hypothetical protein
MATNKTSKTISFVPQATPKSMDEIFLLSQQLQT